MRGKRLRDEAGCGGKKADGGEQWAEGELRGKWLGDEVGCGGEKADGGEQWAEAEWEEWKAESDRRQRVDGKWKREIEKGSRKGR